MPHLEGMHAPGYECAHVLRAAGFKLPYPPDVYRFNRVMPYYPPDPNCRPNEGDLVCPPEKPPCIRNHPYMPASGTDSRMPSDVFRFYKVYKPTSCNPCKQPNLCSCTNTIGLGHCNSPNKPHYPPSKPSRHFDYRYPAGATECNLPTHRRGHVPKECNAIYPDADELICFDQPRPDDCPICPKGGCVCTGQSAHVYDSRNNNVSMQEQQAYSFAPINTTPLRRNTEFTGDSMYNNTSCGSTHRIIGKCYHSPYAVTGNQFCDKSGFVRDRNAAILPAQRIPCPTCAHSYFQSDYVCTPVYDRTYLLDCPEQDGPPADTYTFL